MAALIDESTLWVVLRFFGPAAETVVIDGRATTRASGGMAPIQKLKHRFVGQQLVVTNRITHILVAVVGASANCLFLRRGGVIASRSEHQDLLDQASARSARCAGFGVFAHLVQGEQTFVFDGFANRAFVHAVAAAHLGVIGHAGGFAVAFMADVANIRFAKHQLFANVGNAASIAQEFEIPTAVDRVAIQTSADQLVVANHQLFVDAFMRIAQDNFFSRSVGAAHEITRAE